MTGTTALRKPSTIQYYQAITNRIQEYVESNIHADISLQRLADHVFVSYYHLSDLFEQAQQETIGGYIKRYRLEKAASLLSYTDLSLTDIAGKTGYSGKQALSKAFRQQFNHSPGHFRKRPLFIKDSPNAIMDGIQSEQDYHSLLKKEFSFTYRIENLVNHYTICRSLRMVPAVHQGSFCYDTYLDTVMNSFDKQWNGRFVIKPFDSLNFTPASRFNMHHGLLVTAPTLGQLSPVDLQQYIISPVKNGSYLVFDIPAGPMDENIKSYTTLFRENIIGYKKLFRPEDFFIFLLLSDGENKLGEFYMYLGSAL
ncbi:AraC family transcriptional regulator [Paraflavitalea soli]|uniref:AraC family transcriptional regulator n=1 Tax=Paraflavitalea soli TaxID=2315862 RepID=A0A3B7MSL7_9BACT|nr:AraC family transcriptional regulator [Paraflavitalea soli]AXY76363.1 AraC family transcriptional regulator [Paraflavitalea soli]